MIKKSTHLFALLLLAGLSMFSLSSYAQLSGNYTIGGSGGNYATFNAAVSALSSQGVSGPVTFTINQGTYNERVVIPSITGASATNTITFDGVDKSSRTLSYTGVSTSNRATIVLNGADYIIFRHLTISNNGSGASALGVFFTSGADHNIIDSCDVLLPIQTGHFYPYPMLFLASSSESSYYGYGTNASYNTISNNYCQGAYYAARFNGGYSSSTLDNVGNKFLQNDFDKVYYYGIYLYRQGSYEIIGNTFRNWQYQYAYPVYCYYGQGGKIKENEIHSGSSGIRLYYENYYNQTGSSEIVNNMIMDYKNVGGWQYGIYAYRAYNVDYLHNSVWIASGSGGFYYSGLTCYYNYYCTVKNNMFYNTGNGYAFSSYYSNWNNGAIDNNNYYASNSNLVYWYSSTYGTKTYSLLSDWKTDMSQFNSGSTQYAPHFNDFTDLHYSSGTVPVFGPYMSNVPIDIDGETRDQPNTMLGADEHAFPDHDLDIIAITSPVVPALGYNTVSLTFTNSGKMVIPAQTLTFGYSINGGSWVNETYTLTSAIPAFSQPMTFTFSSPWYIPAGGTYDLCVRVNPQIAQDPDPGDSICIQRCTGLQGNYVIDVTGGGDYTTFDDAISDMVSCGVSGPVNFTVKPGIYSRFEIPEIMGTSAQNTITFTGTNRKDVIIYHASSNGYGTANDACIEFAGGDWVRIKNMTVKNTASYWGVGVLFTNGSDNNIVDNLDIQMEDIKTSGYYTACVSFQGQDNNFYSQGSWNNNQVLNSELTGAYYGARLYGAGSNNTISNCNINSPYYYGIYSYYPQGTKILYNRITDLNNSAYGYGINSYYGGGDTIMGNIIKGAGRYGIYSYRANYNTQSYHTVIANNMISKFQSATYQTGIYMYFYNYNVHVTNNTIWVSGSSNTYYNAAIYVYYYPYYSEIINNILISDNKTRLISFYFAYNLGSCDYNDYYHTGNATYYFYNRGDYTWNTFKNNTSYIGVHDQNSYYLIDPEVISADDLHLIEGSSGLTGVSTWNPVDVDGDPRCQLVRFLGADEPAWKVVKSDFVYDDTMCYGTPVTFYNTGIEEDPHITEWYLNGGFETSDFDYTHSFMEVGYDTVTLVQQTCAGTDTVERNIYIDSSTVAPTVDFVAEKNIYERGEQVFFNDLSKDCPDQWTWNIDPDSAYDYNSGQNKPAFHFEDNTDANSKNPVVVFDYSGAYDVTLTAQNSIGSATEKKVKYINVKFSDNLCGMFNETNQLYGSLYDDGGPNANHGTYKSCDYLIKPCSDDIIVEFKEMSIGAGAYLRLYDGADNRGIPMWDITNYPMGLTGSMGNPNFDTTLTSTQSGMVYVEFVSGGNTASGFKMEWTAIGTGNYTAPIAEFTSEDTACIVYPMLYENISACDTQLTRFTWDYDGNGLVDDTKVNGSFSTTFPGVEATYKTTLTAENCGGIDTFWKKIVLINPQTAPTGDFYADVTQPVSNQDIVTFYNPANRLSCVNTWKWEITPGGYYYENGTNQFMENPQIVFTDTVCYDVKLIMGNTNSAYTTTLLKNCYIKPKKYCSPIVLNLHQDVGISHVAVGDIDNYSSMGQSGYSNFTNQASTDLIMGQQYKITIERNTAFNAVSRKVWIDWDNDGLFEEPNEMVVFENNSLKLKYTGTFTVPTTASLGASVMRVSVGYAGYDNSPCGPSKFGEYEDYRVFVSPDNVPPVITLKGDPVVYNEIGYTYVDSGATAWDNLQGDISSQIQSTSTVDKDKMGIYYVSYNVCDSIGNCATEVKRKVVITEDKTAPVITLYGSDPAQADVNRSFVDPGYLAWDNGDGDITANVVITDNLDTSQLGSYTRTYYVEDSKGMSTTVTRGITVTDGAAPDIILYGDNPMYLEIGTPYVEPGDTFFDNFWPRNKINHQINGVVDVTKAGAYEVYYSATDYLGNGPNVVTRQVIVWDSSAPTVIAKGGDVIEVEVYTQFIDPGLKITDNATSGFSIRRYGTFLNNFPDEIPTQLGNFIIFYEVTDPSGNKAEILGRVVKVVDSHAPVITLSGSPYMIMKRWEYDSFPEPGYTITDNFYNLSELTVTIENDVNTLLQGLYTVKYTAEDPSGNVSPTVVRLVRVTYDTLSSINEITASSVNIYPNPTNGKFTIELDVQMGQDLVITVFNLLGEEVKDIHRGILDRQKFEVDLSNEAEGIYIVKVQNGDNVVLKQIMLTR